jgi:hypothetical protein
VCATMHFSFEDSYLLRLLAAAAARRIQSLTLGIYHSLGCDRKPSWLVF